MNRYASDIPATITGQHHYHHQPDSTTTTTSSATGSTTGSTTTRACARAREAEARASMLHGQYVDICGYYAQAFHRSPAPGIQRELAVRIRDGMSAEVLRAIVDETMQAPRPSWAYMAAILRRCDLENIKTMQDWNDSKSRYQQSRNPALNYEQRHWIEDDFGKDFFFDVVAAYKKGGDQD